MNIKAKLRRIGNSMGVILPANVITGYVKGDVITLNIITARWPDKTHEEIEKLYERPDVITKDSEVITPKVKGLSLLDKKIADGTAFNQGEPSPRLEPRSETDVETKSGLAPDSFPIQHTNSMKVGYVPKGVTV